MLKDAVKMQMHEECVSAVFLQFALLPSQITAVFHLFKWPRPFSQVLKQLLFLCLNAFCCHHCFHTLLFWFFCEALLSLICFEVFLDSNDLGEIIHHLSACCFC